MAHEEHGAFMFLERILSMEAFPAPLPPMMPHRSPWATVKVMFLKRSVAPNEMPTLETESRVTLSREQT